MVMNSLHQCLFYRKVPIQCFPQRLVCSGIIFFVRPLLIITTWLLPKSILPIRQLLKRQNNIGL